MSLHSTSITRLSWTLFLDCRADVSESASNLIPSTFKIHLFKIRDTHLFKRRDVLSLYHQLVAQVLPIPFTTGFTQLTLQEVKWFISSFEVSRWDVLSSCHPHQDAFLCCSSLQETGIKHSFSPYTSLLQILTPSPEFVTTLFDHRIGRDCGATSVLCVTRIWQDKTTW